MNNKILAVKPLGFPWETQDPFLFCAYHRDEYPKGNDEMGPAPGIEGRDIGQDFTIKDGWRMYHGQQIPGFPYHPHRGFETITINKEGMVDHTDSLGASGRFGAGDVQWMTAGKGVQHSEMFPLVSKEKENPLEIFQVWLNLPSKSKFVDPHFKMLWNEEIPELIISDEKENKTYVNLIAGNINGKKSLEPTPDSWASNPENEVCVLTIKMDAHATWTLSKADKEANRSLYYYKGDTLTLEDQSIDSGKLMHVKADESIQIINGDKPSYLLMLQGKPINEPVAQYGPFVMNTQEEIQQAFADYRATQFGGWPWPKTEQAHPREVGRFAVHADGRREDR